MFADGLGAVMTELTTSLFGDYFQALWRHKPFAWQQALAKQVLEDAEQPWPEAIALPTASGKTACIDIAVYALAAQASQIKKGNHITAPRRIFFVVDRRIIVDEAYARAEKLARKLAEAQEGILKETADALRIISSGSAEGPWRDMNDPPLTAHTLRGASYRADSWARSPLQPAIIASTIDQIGSRLLFRAYGRGTGMWPVYAGLVANDSLILLDEAHCAHPFLETLQAVRHYRKWGTNPLCRSFYPVVLSATPPPGLKSFKDESTQPTNPQHPLGRRQLAHKLATVREIKIAKGKNSIRHFAEELGKEAEILAEKSKTRNNGKNPAIVVFANRVATARSIRDYLANRHSGRVTLLTGRMRSIDKSSVICTLQELASSESGNRDLDAPHFIIATQTLEVGADLDFDVLVTECASLDALRQRFGRLNRMGRAVDACATILLRGDQEQNDPVYGSAVIETFEWLHKKSDKASVVDFGIAHLEPPTEKKLEYLNSPIHNAPVMLPAHVDCLVQTHPIPEPSPEVSLFLHGLRETRAEIQVCWRINPTEKSLQLCPPVSSEMLPVKIGVLGSWLRGELVEDASSDVEGEASSDNATETAENIEKIDIFLLKNSGKIKRINKPNEPRPGDVIIVDTSNANNSHLDFQHLGELPTPQGSPTEIDVSQQAYLESSAKALLRLYDPLIDLWPSSDAKKLAQNLLTETELENSNPDTQLNLVRRMLDALVCDSRNREEFVWLHATSKQLQTEARQHGFLRNLHHIGKNDVILKGQNLLPEFTRQAETFNDEDDHNSSGIANKKGQPISLRTHLPGVEAWARHFAVGCGLADELVDAVARAGLLHDTGKADPRFQILLNGGCPLPMEEPLAKSASIPKTVEARKAAQINSGYPSRGRHELLSVRLAESVPELLPEDPLLHELTLFLVSSHHGYCRPFAPVVTDPDAPEVRYRLNDHEMVWFGPTHLEHLKSGTARRFWLLVETYGWWGLAWLEAILRLADHRRSEWEELHD